jgi:catechol 2,3-dioxygenase-like lactoylglutathione lyase family enzyme
LPVNGHGLKAAGLSHLVLEVDDLAVADFYRDTLGFAAAGTDMISDCGRSVVLAGADGAYLVLSERKDRPDLSATGVHQAYAVGPDVRRRIGEKLSAQGIEIKTYKEDRPAEEKDNFYFFDPAGNRLQLVVSAARNGGAPALDHAAIQVANMWWAETFYTGTLACAVEHRVGWKTEDYARAQLWADGKEDMAPGTRRMDKRYTSMVNQRSVPRVNLQIYLRIGEVPFAVYLANQHFQEPPEEALVGTPRTAFTVTSAALDETCRRLEAAQWPFLGPRSEADGLARQSLFFKDPGGNFIELCVRADA